MNSVFDTDCLAAPAGKPFTIVFDNQDPSIPHNLSIYTDEECDHVAVHGGHRDRSRRGHVHVDALEAGTYFFRCDVHPTTMTGTFVVE